MLSSGWTTSVVLLVLLATSHSLDDRQVESKVDLLRQVIGNWTSAFDKLTPDQHDVVAELVDYYAPESYVQMSRLWRNLWTSCADSDEVEFIRRLLQSESPTEVHFGAILMISTPECPCDLPLTLYDRIILLPELWLYHQRLLLLIAYRDQYPYLLYRFYKRFLYRVSESDFERNLGIGKPLRTVWYDLLMIFPRNDLEMVSRMASSHLSPARWAQLFEPAFRRILKEKQTFIAIDDVKDGAEEVYERLLDMTSSQSRLYTKYAIVSLFMMLPISSDHLVLYFYKIDYSLIEPTIDGGSELWFAEFVAFKFHQLYTNNEVPISALIAHAPQNASLFEPVILLSRSAGDNDADLGLKIFLGEMLYSILSQRSGSSFMQLYSKMYNDCSSDVALADFRIASESLAYREFWKSSNHPPMTFPNAVRHLLHTSRTFSENLEQYHDSCFDLVMSTLTLLPINELADVTVKLAGHRLFHPSEANMALLNCLHSKTPQPTVESLRAILSSESFSSEVGPDLDIRKKIWTTIANLFNGLPLEARGNITAEYPEYFKVVAALPLAKTLSDKNFHEVYR